MLQHFLGWSPLFSGPIYGVGIADRRPHPTLMILPTVTAISRDVIAAIPTDLREASMALGATKWETMSTVVLPAARTGIFGALILALGRAFGETIAATMIHQLKPSGDRFFLVCAVIYACERHRKRIYGSDDRRIYQCAA